MFGMGQWELFIILLVVLLVFGAKRIPDAAQGLGRGIREFRKAMREVQDEIDINAPAKTVQAPPPTQAVAQTATPAPAAPVATSPAAPAAAPAAPPADPKPPVQPQA